MTISELRPLSLGELLDRSFSYYRRHFWVFVGIMAVPQLFGVATNLVLQAIQVLGSKPGGGAGPPAPGPQFAGYVAGAFIGTLGVIVIYGLVYAVALGATTFAVSEIHLGQTTGVRLAFSKMRGQVWRLVDLIISVFVRLFGCFILAFGAFGALSLASALTGNPMAQIVGVLVGVAALLLSFAVVIVLMLRYGVSIPALVLEKTSARAAIKRSVLLTKGFLGRVFLIGLLMTLVSWVVASIFQGPFLIAAFVLALKQIEAPLWLGALTVIAGGVGGTLSGPLLMIPLALLYYDLRVRKEGFDLQLMMAALDRGTPTSAALESPAASAPHLEQTSVAATVVLTFVTLGIYVPIWYLRRRSAINQLRSGEKLGLAPFVFVLTIWTIDLILQIAQGVPTGFGTYAAAGWFENIDRIVTLVGGIILILQAFKVRRILLDHSSARRPEMFSGISLLEDQISFSSVATFFLGIWYLQHKINQFVDTWAQERAPVPSPVAPPVIS